MRKLFFTISTVVLISLLGVCSSYADCYTVEYNNPVYCLGVKFTADKDYLLRTGESVKCLTVPLKGNVEMWWIEGGSCASSTHSLCGGPITISNGSSGQICYHDNGRFKWFLNYNVTRNYTCGVPTYTINLGTW